MSEVGYITDAPDHEDQEGESYYRSRENYDASEAGFLMKGHRCSYSNRIERRQATCMGRRAPRCVVLARGNLDLMPCGRYTLRLTPSPQQSLHTTMLALVGAIRSRMSLDERSEAATIRSGGSALSRFQSKAGNRPMTAKTPNLCSRRSRAATAPKSKCRSRASTHLASFPISRHIVRIAAEIFALGSLKVLSRARRRMAFIVFACCLGQDRPLMKTG